LRRAYTRDRTVYSMSVNSANYALNVRNFRTERIQIVENAEFSGRCTSCVMQYVSVRVNVRA